MLRTAFDVDQYFSPNFESVIPRVDGSFELLLSKRLSLSFFNLIMINDKKSIDTNLLDVIVELNVLDITKKVLEARIANIEEFEDERIERHFSGHRKPIFFDLEESSRLTDIFINFRFLSDVEVMYDGKPVKFRKLKPADQERIERAMTELGIINEQDPSEYKQSANIRRVKKLTKRSQYKGGSKIMNKKDLMKKTAAGTVVMAVGAVMAMAGGLTAHKALSSLLGVSNEVILVENDAKDE